VRFGRGTLPERGIDKRCATASARFAASPIIVRPNAAFTNVCGSLRVGGSASTITAGIDDRSGRLVHRRRVTALDRPAGHNVITKPSPREMPPSQSSEREEPTSESECVTNAALPGAGSLSPAHACGSSQHRASHDHPRNTILDTQETRS
jgi:hypothetical protein